MYSLLDECILIHRGEFPTRTQLLRKGYGVKMTLQHHFIYRHSLHTNSFEETTFSHAATRRGKGNKRFLESPWTQFHGITGIGFKLTLFSERSLCSNKESRSRTLKERELERVWHCCRAARRHRSFLWQAGPAKPNLVRQSLLGLDLESVAVNGRTSLVERILGPNIIRQPGMLCFH